MGNEQDGVEDIFLGSKTGTVAIRLYDNGKLLLGVQLGNGPEKVPEVMIELTPRMQQKLVSTIGSDYDVHTEQYGVAMGALEDVVASETHEEARKLAKAALHEIESLDD